MKRAKKYLRSLAWDNRLSHLHLLDLECELFIQLITNPKEVIDYLATMENKRMQLV